MPPQAPPKIFLHAFFFSPPTRKLAARSLLAQSSQSIKTGIDLSIKTSKSDLIDIDFIDQSDLDLLEEINQASEVNIDLNVLKT